MPPTVPTVSGVPVCRSGTVQSVGHGSAGPGDTLCVAGLGQAGTGTESRPLGTSGFNY